MAQHVTVLSDLEEPGAGTALVEVPWPAGGLWQVLHTKSRQEKALAETLAARAIPFFLPLVTEVRYVGRRKITTDLPLFPGYVFLKGSLDDSYEADRTRRVAHIIAVPHQQSLEWELSNIYMALSHRVPLDPHPYLREGVKVRVAGGPLRGLEGVVEKRLANRNRLMLQVQTLGRALSLEIEASLLETI